MEIYKGKINCPEIYGDPAILMPQIYMPDSDKLIKREEYIIIPHYSKLENYKNNPKILSTIVKDYKLFIDRIVGAELVISSSLHGIILAEAYGIPAIMLSDTPSADITKYKDWYFSTGRNTFPIANSIEEALSIKASVLDANKLKNMQKQLIESFPYDLWE